MTRDNPTAADDPEQAQFVARFAQAWASRDPAAFEALWHPAGRLYYPFADRVIEGHEIGQLNRITGETAPDLTWRLLGWTARGATVVAEWESSNRFGDRQVTWRGVDRFILRDGRILEEVVYTDTAPLQALRRGETFAPLLVMPGQP